MFGVGFVSAHQLPLPRSHASKAAAGVSAGPLPLRGGARVLDHAASPASQCTKHVLTQPPCCGRVEKGDAASEASNAAA